MNLLKNPIVFLTVTILVMTTFAVSFFLYQRTKRVDFSKLKISPPLPSVTAIPTPFPLATGKQTYSVSQGKGTVGPKISKVEVDPLDAAPGGKQQLSVEVNDSTPVTSVSAIFKTDTTNKTYDLTLSKGSKYNGTWTGSWVLEDTHDFIYKAEIKAQGKEESSVELSFR